MRMGSNRWNEAIAYRLELEGKNDPLKHVSTLRLSSAHSQRRAHTSLIRPRGACGKGIGKPWRASGQSLTSSTLHKDERQTRHDAVM